MKKRESIYMKEMQEKNSENANTSPQKQNDTLTSDPKSVYIVGNSHTSSNFRLTNLSQELKVEKCAAMTIGQAKKAIESITVKKGTIVLHELTNDIGRNEAEAVKVSNDYIEIIKNASTKADHVIVSLGLPRNDDRLKHQLTQMINWRLKSRFQDQMNIKVCEHDNMLYYGKPNGNYLAGDGYHLSTMGKVIFAKNLVRSIHAAMGVHTSSTQGDTRGDDRRSHGEYNRYGMHRNNGNGQYYGYRRNSYQDGYYRDSRRRNYSSYSQDYNYGREEYNGYR